MPDLFLRYSDAYGSGSDTRAVVLLGCGGGAYAIGGEMRLGPAGSAGEPQRIGGGHVVEWFDRGTFRQSGEIRYRYAAYRLDPRSWGIRFLGVEETPEAARALLPSGEDRQR